MSTRKIFALLIACVISSAANLSIIAADLQSPEAIKNGLRMLAYVQNDMSRKLSTKSFERLPHENQEFQEAAAAMRAAVAKEPTELKNKVDAQLNKAQAAANNVAELSKTQDEAKITTAVQAVDNALKPLNEIFPEALRPIPGELGRGGPPPGIR